MIRLVDVVKEFDGKRKVRALDGVSLEIDRGEMVALVGPSGSGKSTLLNLIGTLDRPTSGEIYIDGQKLSGLSDTELTLLCEGDMTFRAYDIDKFLAYIPHAEIVNGTRIVEQLRERRTQLTTFMYYGNFFVGKLLEAKHIGRGTFTDVGTTYKLCRNEALRRLLPHLNPAVNLEFNAHFLDVALARGFHIVECPVTFHNRVGASKGGNRSNWRALTVGLRMIAGLVAGWPARRK